MSGDFVIRCIANAAERRSCVLCGVPVGSGPIGWRSSPAQPAGPVCDACLADHCPELSSILRIVNLSRELAEAPRTLAASLAFRGAALGYHTRARWPLRPAGFDELVQRVVQIFDDSGKLRHLHLSNTKASRRDD